jgi:hypothetical protein
MTSILPQHDHAARPCGARVNRQTTTWKRALLLLEMAACFGPAFLFLFLGLLGAFAAFGQSPMLGLGMVLWIGLGVLGALAVIHLVAHAVDEAHALPSRKILFTGCICGVAACSIGLSTSAQLDWSWLLFGLPVLGTAHLLHISRKREAAEASPGATRNP